MVRVEYNRGIVAGIVKFSPPAARAAASFAIERLWFGLKEAQEHRLASGHSHFLDSSRRFDIFAAKTARTFQGSTVSYIG